MKRILFIVLSLTLMACNSRYAYRTKVRVNHTPVHTQKTTPAIDSTIEASEEMHYISNTPSAIDTSFAENSIASFRYQKTELIVSGSSTKQVKENKQALSAPAEKAKKKGISFLAIITVLGLVFTGIGIWLDMHPVEGAGLSPFTFFGVLLLLLALFISIIKGIAYSVKQSYATEMQTIPNSSSGGSIEPPQNKVEPSTSTPPETVPEKPIEKAERTSLIIPKVLLVLSVFLFILGITLDLPALTTFGIVGFLVGLFLLLILASVFSSNM